MSFMKIKQVIHLTLVVTPVIGMFMIISSFSEAPTLLHVEHDVSIATLWFNMEERLA